MQFFCEFFIISDNNTYKSIFEKKAVLKDFSWQKVDFKKKAVKKYFFLTLRHLLGLQQKNLEAKN